MNAELPNDDFDDTGLEEALARHVAGELRPQSGRAEAGFIAFRRRARHWRHASMLGAAAAVLVAVGIARLVANRPVAQPPAMASAKANETPVVQCVTYDKTFDAGAAEINGIPARAYRSEIVDQTECFDPATRITLSTTVPHEQWEVETPEQY